MRPSRKFTITSRGGQRRGMRHAAVRGPHPMRGQPTIEESNETTGGLQNGATQAANAYR